MPAVLRQPGKLPVPELGKNKISGAHMSLIPKPGSRGEKTAKPQAATAPRRGQAGKQKHGRTRGPRRSRGHVSAVGSKGRASGRLARWLVKQAWGRESRRGCPRGPAASGIQAGGWS